MIKRLGFGMALVVAQVVFGGLAAPTAQAGGNGCPPGTEPSDTGGGTICIPVNDPGGPGGGEPGEPGGEGGGGHQTCTYQGQKIPCTGPNGVWFSSHQCYAQPMSPQPPADDPKWEGHDPSEGNVWQCTRPGVDEAWLYFFYANGEVPPMVDPAELAQEALESMALAIPDVHIAPTPPDMTYVNLETWLWMSEGKFDTLTKTVSAGATSVTVTARPVRAWWEMGDGGETSCITPGRAWKSWMNDSATTDCSYTYLTTSRKAPDGEFKVQSAIWYQADWTCSGACLQSAGTLGEVSGLTGSQSIRVGERQSVIVGGSS